MCDTPSAADGSAAPTPSPPSWSDLNVQLATAWLTSFGQAVMAHSADTLTLLFHPHAITFGASTYGPCDRFDATYFSLLADTAKIAPLDRHYSLITVHWQVNSPILNGTPRPGRATFVIYSTDPTATSKGCVQCVHAHYSTVA